MTENELKILYDNSQYSKIIEIYRSEDKKQQALNLYSGFSFVEMGYAKEATVCFNNINRIHTHPICGKIYRYIGIANYLLSNYELAKSSFCLGKKNDDRESCLWNKLLFPSLHEFRETESINFRFVDEINLVNKKIFIMKNLKAYSRINTFIGQKYNCKKIDIYVYTKRNDSIGNALSYSDNGMKIIHTYFDDVSGHEIAHILFNSIYKDMQRNRFIDEGIATYFNEELSFDEFVKRYCNDFTGFDVIQLWNNHETDLFHNTQDYYYFAGAFVGYLIDIYGKDKFLHFIKNEDITFAKKIFGVTLELSIQKFYNIINTASEGKF